MNIQFQRMVDRVIGVPLCGVFSLIQRFKKKPKKITPPQKILIILLSEMGSLVLASPMFQYLKNKYPNADIYGLLFAKNREVLDLMELIPPSHVLTLNDSSFKQFAFDSIKMIHQLRQIHFDVVIDCELFSRVSSIFAYLSGAPLLIGFHPHTQEGLYRGSFINRRIMYNPYHHLTSQFLTMAAAIESTSVPTTKEFAIENDHHAPRLTFPQANLTHLFEQLHKDFPAIKNKRLVLLYPSGGILPIRAWPLENYCQLSANLLADDYAIGVIGLKADKALGQTITHFNKNNPCCIDLTGYTKSVKELLMIFNRASLLITNDGGPGQFAALTSIPSIVFFGPETPTLYGSLAKNAHNFYLNLPCSPCLTAYNHRTSPCDGNNQCLKQIQPTHVLKKAQEILANVT